MVRGTPTAAGAATPKSIDQRPPLHERAWVWAAVALLTFAAYFSPYLLRGQDAFVLVHDNLDNVNRYGAMVDGRLEEIGWRPDRWWAYALGVFWGGVANGFVIRVVAAVGMFALLARLPTTKTAPLAWRALATLGFATLPFYPLGNLSVAGVPALMVLLLALQEKRSVPWALAALVALGVYSRPTLTGPWLLLAIGIWVLCRWRARQSVLPLVLGGVALAVGMSVPAFEIMRALPDFMAGETNRQEIAYLSAGGPATAVGRALKMLLTGQYHAHSLHRPVILPSLAVISIWLTAMRRKGRALTPRERRLALGLILFLGLSAGVYGIFYFAPIMSFYHRLGLGFNFSRIYYFTPAAWHLLWALVLFAAFRLAGRGRLVAVAFSTLLAAQIVVNFEHFTLDAYEKRPTFREYFSQRLFDEVRRVLELEPGEKVGCIGFHPAVAHYHGLPTIGFYTNIYPLAQKRQIQRIIRGELDANAEIRDYFTNWGSRAYLFNAEIGKALGDQERLRKLGGMRSRLDTELLLAAHVRYLLSTVPITNAEEKGWQEVFRQVRSDAYYRMFVYRLGDGASAAK